MKAGKTTPLQASPDRGESFTEGLVNMPPRKHVLPELVRKAALEGTRAAKQESDAAEDRFKMDVYLKTEMGLTQNEIAIALGISQPLVSSYRTQGRAVYERWAAEKDL
jgi:DNA-directed RNA polymerase specialized sigma24 family protein